MLIDPNGQALPSPLTAETSEDGIELVKASCGHYIPLPGGWGAVDTANLKIMSLAGLQAKMDEAAAALGTRYFEQMAFPQLGGEVRRGVLLCPDCEARVRGLLR